MNAKGVHGAVQIIQVKMFLKNTHREHSHHIDYLICSLLSTRPQSHKQLQPPDRGVRRVQDGLIENILTLREDVYRLKQTSD